MLYPEYPKISIITPSYNQAEYLEETILSVLDQDYPNLEYIIIDGGSTDGSIDIINKYESKIASWVSEKDGGQASAIKKGFQMCTGQILAWLNSDDIYSPGVLKKIARCFCAHPGIDVIYGNLYFMDSGGNIFDERRTMRPVPPLMKLGLLYGVFSCYQLAAFWTSNIYRKVGGVDSSLKQGMDNDLLTRFAFADAKFKRIDDYLAAFRVHKDSKSTKLQGGINYHDKKIIYAKYQENIYWATMGIFILRITKVFLYFIQGDGLWCLKRLANKWLKRDMMP
jgi:glycosyltransferase involved in cell wall biosynthesis